MPSMQIIEAGLPPSFAGGCARLEPMVMMMIMMRVTMMMMMMATDHAPECHSIISSRVAPTNKQIKFLAPHENSCAQKRSRRIAKQGGDTGIPRQGLGSCTVRRLSISQGGAAIPRQRLGSCSAGVHRPRLTSLSQTHPPYLVMAAGTLAVTASGRQPTNAGPQGPQRFPGPRQPRPLGEATAFVN